MFSIKRSVGVFALLILATAWVLSNQKVEAAGAFNGEDLLHVPMSWCVIQGSPAAANPNITGLNGNTDSDTDAVIWRRHERPTDNIFINQAGVSLRSAINNAWDILNFPIINDTDTTNGQVGDVNGWNVNADGAEFNDLITNCDQAYEDIGRAGIGITAININLFHDNANPMADNNGDGNPDGDTVFDYVGVLGWGGCNESSPGTCATPYDGRIMVIDNQYLYPTVADRTFPPSPADLVGNLQFPITDSPDQLTGHEVGHALSLDHRTNTLALMNPNPDDNSGDGDADNISLNGAEVTALRTNALNVPGVEIDPPGVFTPGNFVAMRVVDRNRDKDIAPYLDLASVKVVLDREKDEVHIGQTLMGLLPLEPEQNLVYAYLVDTDNNSQTGCNPDALKNLGIDSLFEGADLVATATLTGGPIVGFNSVINWFIRSAAAAISSPEISGKAFRCSGDQLVAIDDNLFNIELHTLRMHPHFAQISDGRPIPQDFIAEVNNTINMKISNNSLFEPIVLDKPFRVQAVIMAGGTPQDRLDDTETGKVFELELPSFPHCFAQGEGTPGGTVDVTVEGLLAKEEIHAFVGPDLVLEGIVTDTNGGASIKLPIPLTVEPGLHLVTIGHDRLALTADCHVETTAIDLSQVCASTPPLGAIVGSSGDDVIDGTEGDDVIFGKSGHDIIDGKGGRDIICGGSGNDIISGGLGNDAISGNSGDDVLDGGDGDDTISGNSGNDILDGGNGNDRLDGGTGIDTCINGETYVSCEKP